MKNSLFQNALFPNTRIYQDANGNFKGSSTDVTPIILLLSRTWGIAVWLYIILTPFLAPVYYVFAHWYCKKYDAEFSKANPKEWSKEKKSILRNHRNILLGWIIFMLWGYCCDWGQNDLPYKYTQPSASKTEYNWEPYKKDSYHDIYSNQEK